MKQNGTENVSANRDPESVNVNQNVTGSKEFLVNNDKGNYKLKVFQYSLNISAHILIGMIVAICLVFTFSMGTLLLSPTYLYIVLCVLGYQLLMSEAILSLSSDNGWSARLKLVHKRRIHWILQILGSGLAIAGSIIMSIYKTVNWNTLHGKFALVALVFTVVSLVNGLTSLYTYELRRFIPPNLSKLTHIVSGVVAFVAANISLCYGFDKQFFKSWIAPELAYISMALTAAFTVIIIINSCVTFVRKSRSLLSK